MPIWGVAFNDKGINQLQEALQKAFFPTLIFKWAGNTGKHGKSGRI